MKYLTTPAVQDLYRALLSLESEEECRKFLGDLLTSAEIKEFSNRWKAAQLLNKKVDYKKIESVTGMSSTTIARISKWLHGTLGGYALVIKRMQDNTTNQTIHHTPLAAV